METRLSREEIRHLVRDLLREALPRAAAPAEPSAGEDANPFAERVRQALQSGRRIEVPLDSDQDLNAFAQSIALCALERDLLGAIASNRVRFRLAGRGDRGKRPAPPAAPRAASGSAFHWERGVLSETRIEEIGKTHGSLVLGPKAVLTPLARDRARELKLEIVRQKQ